MGAHLPEDLIRKVLEYLMEGVAHGPKLPFVLASICRLWREVACTTPELWANILVIQELKEKGAEKYLSFCLERSKQLPLSIDVQHAEPKVFNLLTKAIGRWGHLSCQQSNYIAITDILRRQNPKRNNCFASLTSVDINFGVIDHIQDPRNPKPGHQELWPNLRSLSITCVTPSTFFYLMPASLMELKVRCRIFSSRMLFEIFSICPTLLSIDLMVMKVHLSSNVPSSMSNPPILLLERLTISAGKILSLIVPLASSLISVVLTPSSLADQPIFPTTETTFRSNLKTLTIYVSSKMPNDRMLELAKLLGFLPALEKLVVRGSKADPVLADVSPLFGWSDSAMHNDVLRALVELELRFVDLRSSFENLLHVAERMMNFTDHRDEKPKITFMGCLGMEQCARNALEMIIIAEYLSDQC